MRVVGLKHFRVLMTDGQAEAQYKISKNYCIALILLNFKYKRTKTKQVTKKVGVKITPKNNIPKIF